MNSADARLAFYDEPEPGRAPSPSATRARIDAAASGHAEGPARWHRVHGAITIATDELRVTTQPAHRKGNFVEPARLLIRLWHQGPGGVWWPDSRNRGVAIEAANAEAFATAINAAVARLRAEEPHP